MFCNESLVDFYRTNFNIIHAKQFGSITEIESMMPFERDIYAQLINIHEEQKRQAAEAAKNQ